MIDAPRPVTASDDPDGIADLLAIEPGKRTPQQNSRIQIHARSLDPAWKRLHEKVKRHQATAPKPPDTKAQTLGDAPGSRKTNIHIRGDFLRKGDEVSPHTLAVLPPLTPSTGTPNRLDLARWLVDPSHPLTSRVAVNRIWKNLFGRALVASPDDFGTRGERPSHPELLDWLATEFPSQGWSQKALIRLMVTSSAYRQSSKTRDDLRDRDPNNVWLARQNRFRPEAEIVRDLTLSASGLLNLDIGGPASSPPQPPGISELTYAGNARWIESKGKDRYRRGMYTFFKRTSPYPMLMTFDAPDSNVCAVKRERSNTPLQALTLLNDSVFVECAQMMARRVVDETPDRSTDDRLVHAFRLGLSRPPEDREIGVLRTLFHEIHEAGKANAEASAKLAGPKRPNSISVAEAAAWVAVSRTILNLDEFVTRE